MNTADTNTLTARLNALENWILQGKSAYGEASPNGFYHVGLRVPQVRALLKQNIPPLIGLDANACLETWHFVYNNTRLYEVGSLAIYAYQYKRLTRPQFNTVRQWIRRCDCWEHSDDLSKIYAQVFEEQPLWVLPWLEKWNQSKNPWERRQSVVALLEYAQKRKTVQPFEVLIPFVTNLLDDPEYYVQKGVGWTLREIYNVYPEQTLGFLSENYREIAPRAWSAAIEKLDTEVRAGLNEKRRQFRRAR